jgi:AraC-like DNA-binding protein
VATRILHTGGLGTVGEFVCRADDTAWREVNDIGDAVHLVYPRTHVVIAQVGYPSVLATPNHVMIYDANQPYRRAVADPRGDHCTFVRVEADRVDELLAEVPEGRLPAPALPLDALSYLLAHRLVDLLTAPGPLDLLELEEAIATLARRSLAASRRRRRTVRRERQRHALAEAAKAHLAESFAGRATLGDIGRALHVSPWHLARLFREETGFTLHAYRQQLRLRRALQLLSDGADLTEIALAVGFSSHSHLTTAFSRAFGRPPSRARVAELRTIVEAGASGPS